MDKSERIKDLVELLNKANKAYYQEANEIRLKKLEHWQILQETESVFCLGKWTA